jgi:hypothetical protein
MKTLLSTLATLACMTAPLPLLAQEKAPLSLEHRMLLRCSAAFALIAQGQEAGAEAARQYPPLGTRGKEFFVRSAAEVMDAARLDRAAINAALQREARDLAASRTLEQIMPVCLEALDNSGL